MSSLAILLAVANPHKGQVLPYARFVVLIIPLVGLFVYFVFLKKR
ncbi:MAG: hypothetical protein WCL17_04265 [Actinomycetota bacterium]|jgi:hypothetical protein